MDRQAEEKNLLSRLLSNREDSIMVVLGVVVGLAGGIGAVGFRYLINLFQRMAYGADGNLLDVVLNVAWYYRLWIPAAGGLLVGFIVFFWAREAKGHGVPEVMEAIAVKRGIIRMRVVIAKTLASAVCIGSGGSVGREGPIVQIGSAIGSTTGQLLKVSASRMRTLVGCGAAAGIAATFNAPIAGAMFALEIVLGDFGLATFSPIVISAVTATVVSRYFLGDFPAFIVPAYELVSAWEFPFYVVMGLLCALVAVSFIKMLYLTEDFFNGLKFPGYLKSASGGILLGIAGVYVPQILGVGYGAIDLALLQEYSWGLMLVLLVLKILATSVTIGSGGSGGIFAPSLFMGAMAGGVFGALVHHFFPEITAAPGAYSIVGMGAVVSATTQAPITGILMLFEMTGGYKIILPLMITCIISSLVGKWLFKESIYTVKLIKRGIDIKAGKEVNVLKSIPVRDVMNPDVEYVHEGLSLRQLSEKISKSKYNSFPVLNETKQLIGILSYNDYSKAMFEEDLMNLVVATDLATMDVVTVRMDDSLYDALELIAPKDFSIIPVVSSDSPSNLVGVISRRDIIGAYEKAVIKKSILNTGE